MPANRHPIVETFPATQNEVGQLRARQRSAETVPVKEHVAGRSFIAGSPFVGEKLKKPGHVLGLDRILPMRSHRLTGRDGSI